jgi:hypothetical protein
MNALHFTRRSFVLGTTFAIALATGACGNGSVNNEESARRAYFGIDKAIEKAMNLGMQGFNMATSANIAPQTAMGDVAVGPDGGFGTLVVAGQVDQGMSVNKELRLTTDFTDYEDLLYTSDDSGTIHIIYNGASGGATTLSLSLRNIPAMGDTTSMGTYSGTFMQTLHMSGDLAGDVTLNLTLAGQIHRSADGNLERVAGGSTIMGTAMSQYGTYNVNITR